MATSDGSFPPTAWSPGADARAADPEAAALIVQVRRSVAAGSVDEAAEFARRGLEELPLSPGRQYALALALAAAGDHDFARPLLASALARAPGLRGEVAADAALRDLPTG